MSEIETKACNHCFAQIDRRASVCNDCGRHQGVVGWFSGVSAIVSVVVAVIGMSVTLYNVTQTTSDRNAIEEAREVAAKANLTVTGNPAVSHSNSAAFACKVVAITEDHCIPSLKQAGEALRAFADVSEIQGNSAAAVRDKYCNRLTEWMGPYTEQGLKELMSKGANSSKPYASWYKYIAKHYQRACPGFPSPEELPLPSWSKPH